MNEAELSISVEALTEVCDQLALGGTSLSRAVLEMNERLAGMLDEVQELKDRMLAMEGGR